MHDFTKATLNWYDSFGRDLPWRRTKDPYPIMVSEFMLQQTQVSRVIPKFEAFMTTFPTIFDLAKAPLSQVIALWSGLGYNRRAKFVWQAAQDIVRDFDGVVPETETELLLLHGFGPYTANAVLAFAYNKPVVVIDANVKNVCNKVFGVTEKEIPQLVSQLVPKKRSRDFYNALMDIGSTYYKKNSDMGDYPYKDLCKWYAGENIPLLKKVKPKSFKDSNRFYRGQIMKKLVEKNVLSLSELEDEQNADMYKEALSQLVSEKLVITEKGSIYLPK